MGNLSAQISVNRRDDLGRLLQSVNDLVVYFRNLFEIEQAKNHIVIAANKEIGKVISMAAGGDFTVSVSTEDKTVSF
jgi:hypothetical protein